MSQYRQFVFDHYTFDRASGLLELHYNIDGQLPFIETYRFDFPFVDYDEAQLDRAIQALFFLAGTSYFKTYAPPEIVVKTGTLDQEMAAFFSKTYQRGLGEFWYVNDLDPRTPVNFPVTSAETVAPLDATAGEGLLVAIGGGKDSLVSIEMLRGKVDKLATWSLNHREQLEPLVARIGLPHLWVDRVWDPILYELNNKGAMSGHIPISGIFACVGTVVAILSGYRDVVVSNEQSANAPTLQYKGVDINHQYSKSQEFERDYQAFVRHTLGQSYRYYSFLRPLSEVRIAELFATLGFETYKDVFSSCNRAFVHTSNHMWWCGECPKCAFVFMTLTPFLPRADVETLFGGKNLLLDPALEPTYRKLLGIEGDKPLDCIGDIEESRAAMRLAFAIYPELAQTYHFEIPDDYDFRAVATHEMPPELFTILQSYLQ